ncbi:MAG: acetyl-CoA carboxylase carboxyltransferase subunit alpha [Abitibacteriaceae bacterium]|nr:acetyl-CoA carboxylase carboxyltransferase subunit alpha [Abditibacteriaceae bacterium]MBV9866439.1 acetyl-CoA carboxylase carboxyltransferase subunit alpha [Abditibacteriaceae bacterium]
MLSRWLPFEKPLVEIEEQIEELKRLAARENLDLSDKVRRLEDHKRAVMEQMFAELTPWEKVQMARHPKRPYPLDYIGALCSEWLELHGDRAYGDDGAIVAGFGRFSGRAVAIVGNQKGRDTKERQERNFGQASPEGLRKAERVMELAARYGRPIISLVDTPGAACSPDAEERGISEAIAHSQLIMSQLPVPIIVVITGEGCSGGAIATALGDRVLMLEHSYYSVISPEGCASILYRDPAKAPESAEALNITAEDALRLHIIEEVIPEPLGGAHRDFGLMCKSLGATLERHLGELSQIPGPQLIEQRYARFRRLGDFEEQPSVAHPELNGNGPKEAASQLNGL